MKGIKQSFFIVVSAVFILLIGSSAFAQSGYRWPLPESRELTSGFGQWRSGHFHSGIDIRTFGKTGYKCVAISDGHVERIVTRWDGYGKALYLKLDDGRVAVYAHLQKFTHDINVYVQEQQLATKRYMTNLYPPKELFRFKAGDVVAYSGQTGAGAPHLHFEVRDSDSRPLSPLQFYPKSMTDTREPVVRSIFFRPLDPVRARIAGKAEAVEVDLGSSGGRYVSFEPTVIYGPVGVEIDCIDLRPGTRRSYAAHKVEMYIDDESRPFFSTVYDTLSFDHWGEVNLETNYTRAIDGRRFVRNLYVLPGAKTPHVNDIAVNNGWLEVNDSLFEFGLTPGEHVLLICVQDESGNETWAEVHIELRGQPKLVSTDYGVVESPSVIDDRFNYSYALYDRQIDGFESVVGGAPAQELVEFLSGDIGKVSAHRDLAGRTILLTATDRRASSSGARFDYIVRMSNTGMPVFAPSGAVPMSSIASGKVESWYSALGLEVSALADALDDLTSSAASVCYGLDVLFDPADSSILVGATDVATTDLISVKFGRPFVVSPSQGTGSIAQFGSGRLIVEGSDLNHPVGITIDTVTVGVSEYGIVSALVTSPRDLLLEDYVHLEFDLPRDADTAGLAVFSISEEGKPSLVPTEIRNDTVMVAKVGRMGTYALMRDSRGPSITRVSPRDGGLVRSKRPKITFMLDDNLAGIGDDRDVLVEVDGVWAIPEYDPETKWMVTYSSQELKAGHHVLNITVYDKVGNKTSHSSTFTYRP